MMIVVLLRAHVRPDPGGTLPPPHPIPTTTTTAPPPSGTDPRFSTCAAAKRAGYGPYYRGVDPEYSWYRDADSDGIVCE